MKIIDAHLHLFSEDPVTDAMARQVGHRQHTWTICGRSMENCTLPTAW
ncbi:MAG: hypothetical protein ACLUIW_00420 [Dysosmobacter welbionis]